MSDAAELIAATSNYAWPLVVFVIFLAVRPLIRQLANIVQARGGVIEVAGFKLTVAEDALQSRRSIESLQDRVAELELQLSGVVLSSEEAPPKDVLWLDDQPENNAHIVDLICSRGGSVDAVDADDGVIDLIKQERFDVIISDMGRKRVRDAGLRFFRKCRANGIDIPFIFFTSDTSVAEYADTLKQLGAFEVTSSTQDLIVALKKLQVL